VTIDTETTLGSAFAQVLAEKDFDGVRQLLHPDKWGQAVMTLWAAPPSPMQSWALRPLQRRKRSSEKCTLSALRRARARSREIPVAA
jgi:hypothetical protein